jgi:hypothetical protein
MNTAQKIQLARIKIGSFNNFDGEKVAKDLQDNEDLWQAFVFGRFNYAPLIELRDLADDYINVDTIYLLLPKNKLNSFLKLIKNWQVDEVGYFVHEKGKIKAEGTIDFNPNDIPLKLGTPLDSNQVLMRLWWD